MRKILYVISWIPFFMIKLGLFLLGLFVVPLAIITERLSGMWWSIFWVWGNKQEGCPDWWLERDHPWYIKYWPRYWWYAIRNPVNNMRFLFKDYPLEQCHVETNWTVDDKMEAAQMRKAGQKMAYRWVWRGWKAGYRCVTVHDNLTYSEMWFGWKLGSSVPGCGFTAQFRRNRRIGS